MRPFWLQSQGAKLFCLSFSSDLALAPRARGLLLIPPFGEELNKCRRMMSMAARSAAADGHQALMLDLFGTGDSEGDFGDACVERWLGDLKSAADYLVDRGAESIDVLAVRGGSLLLDSSLLPARVQAGRLILWQPVLSGGHFVAQFLRLRIASELATGGPRENLKDLWSLLDKSGSIEVGGYRVSKSLLRGLESRDLSATLSTDWRQIAWFEVGVSDSDSLGPASTRVADGVASRGADVTRRTICGEPFWGTPEIAMVPGLIGITSECILGHMH